jgi:hypothetical protein
LGGEGLADSKLRTSIYIDTNKLQDYFGNKNVCLDGFRMSNDYYKLVKYVDDNDLGDKVSICIPRIVFEEMMEHLISGYKSAQQSFNDTIINYKKIFGDLLDIDFEITPYDLEAYKDFILKDFEQTIKQADNKFTIVEYPDCLPTMIRNALQTVSPFCMAKGKNNKEYSDAGFKDALLFESIINHSNLENERVILFTQDGDFKNIITHETFIIANNIDCLLETINDIYQIDPYLKLKRLVEDNYHRELLLSFADCEYDAAVSDFNVLDINALEEELVVVQQECIINETKYTFTYYFDSMANEISECKYEITND